MSEDTQKQDPADARRATRAAAALAVAEKEDRVLALRLQGWSYERIAVEVGYSNRSAAAKAHQRAVERVPARNAATAKSAALDRYSQMIAVWLPKALAGDVEADRRLLAWEERLARLQGIDAPTRVVIPRGPVDEAIEQLAAELAAMQHDVVEGELVERA